MRYVPSKLPLRLGSFVASAAELHVSAAAVSQQVQRLENIFEQLGEDPEGHECQGMKGVIKEGEEAIEAFKDSDVLDAALIAAAQRVEHYEMAGYGCARTYAHMLGLTEQSALLQRTLDEEGDTDHKLTDLAETVVNIDALK